MTIVQALNFAEWVAVNRPDLLPPGTSLPMPSDLTPQEALAALESLANLRRHLQAQQAADANTGHTEALGEDAP